MYNAIMIYLSRSINPFITTALLISACWLFASACSSSNTTEIINSVGNPEPLGKVGSIAQEIQNVDGWINSEAFTLSSLRGQVVLIDFWTYTCVNCIRTLPYLKEWHNKYADQGLVIVGVHSPEFEFEHISENVQAAVQEFGIEWPVIQDNDFNIWRSFANKFWPAKYLIDKNGVIQYTHFGEGSYNETEMEIRRWLFDAGSALEGIPPNPDPGPIRDKQAGARDIKTRQTRELFTGLQFNANAQPPYITQPEFYENPIGTPVLLEDPGGHVNHFLYLNGLWLNGKESIRHARITNTLEDYLALKFFGTSVNVVLSVENEPYKVYITLEDKPIPFSLRGTDIEEGLDGKTYINVTADRMYSIFDSNDYGGHAMRLSSNSNEFSIFSFTFGAYQKGQ